MKRRKWLILFDPLYWGLGGAIRYRGGALQIGLSLGPIHVSRGLG